MSTQERIGRLQDLLERVQMRAQEPRTNGATHRLDAPAPAIAAQAAEPVYFAPEAPTDQATPTPVPVELVHVEVVHVEVVHEESLQVAYAAAAEADGVEAYLPSDDDADVEVSSETVEIDIDVDEPMPMESGAQPVAQQQTTPPADFEEELLEQRGATRVSLHPPAHEEEVMQAAPPSPVPANEIEEPAPSSSRRPIAAEEVAEPPRHTPPPESGKQVAAPSVHPSVRPSAPPPSVEGHTLVGGWREPGLGPISPISPVPSSPTPSTGVRVPGPSLEQPARASGTRLSPDVTRPELAASANVAAFEGAAPVAKPATLGELLDMTLGL